MVALIIFDIYLTLTLCFYFGLLAWLLRTIPLLRKLKDYGRGKCCMSSLGKKFGNGLLGFDHASICNPNFTWIRSAEKIVQMLKSCFSILEQG